jgi:hypothetical protein
MNEAKLPRRLEDVKTYGNTSEAQAEIYDRNHPRYPYKSHGQWLKACYGMVSCIILVLFNGIGPFLERPFDVHRFIASYISVSSPTQSLHSSELTFQIRCLCSYYLSWVTSSASMASKSPTGAPSDLMICATRSKPGATYARGGWSYQTMDLRRKTA